MTADILHMKDYRKPCPTGFNSLGEEIPCDVEPRENNLRPDGTPIVATAVMETNDREPTR